MALSPRADWVSSQQAARCLGLTSRTLYRLIDRGQLPAYRFGRVIRLQRGDIEDYITSCRLAPGTLGHLHIVPGNGPDGAERRPALDPEDEQEPPVDS